MTTENIGRVRSMNHFTLPYLIESDGLVEFGCVGSGGVNRAHISALLFICLGILQYSRSVVIGTQLANTPCIKLLQYCHLLVNSVYVYVYVTHQNLLLKANAT